MRQILPDIAVVGIAQQTPKSVRATSNGFGASTVVTSEPAPPTSSWRRSAKVSATDDAPKVREPSLSKDLRPVVTLVTAWISQLARDHQLDPALLATRSDVEGLLADNPASRLHEGWRAAMVGEPIRQLARGDAALAFIGDGRLTLEARSHQPLH
ncbi:MAG: hypothetical protein R2710_28710 [Acidimicrobiales bacterium]